MWDLTCEDDVNICDVVQATVTGNCRAGVFLSLEDGQEAFSKFSRLLPGTVVLCTVLKKATERWKILVSIDSILEVNLAA